MKGWDSDVERQLGKAGDEGNKGKEGEYKSKSTTE